MREYTLSNNADGHLLAISGAVLLHLIITAWVMIPSRPSFVREQFIQVNLARPSQEVSQKSAAIKLHNNFIAAKKSEGLTEISPASNKVVKSNKEIQNSSATTGQTAKDAIADNGAYTKPIFDAPSLQNGAPQYPEYARRNNIQGKVMLEVQVTKEGSASAVSVVGSSGFASLDKAAYEAVKDWHFIPAKLNGKIVETPMSVVVPVIFSFS